MKKIILVDGNNLMYRSYYATAYSGNFMKNSKGFPTNALFGFTNMLNKILNEEKPEYMMVAFDKGKTFRHSEYKEYKGGRNETPEELKVQFPVAKELLNAMGIKYYEIDNYEADDIIGSFAQFCDEDEDFIGTIVSSDKDLLQLISSDIEIKLLKQKDYIRYNEKTFEKEYGIKPINVIDLKALMGDPSDNIPGVKGVGEKTALRLLREYHDLDNVYKNIDLIKGKLKEKLIDDKDNAYLSKRLATIVKDIPMEINIEEAKYNGINEEKLIPLYEKLEFYSFLKKNKIKEKPKQDYIIVKDINEIKIEGPFGFYLEIFGNNYHTANIIGAGIYNENACYYVPFEILRQNPSFLIKNEKYTYDLKKTKVALSWQNINCDNFKFDSMTAAYLLDYNVKDDIAYLAKEMGYDLEFYEKTYGKFIKLQMPDEETIARITTEKAKFIFETREILLQKLEEENVLKLYQDIEFPLSFVLADMEKTGVKVDETTLRKMGEEIKIKLELLTDEIYELSEEEFNISSPQQLAYILFDKLGLKAGKKRSTAIDVLERLEDKHPIISLIMEYRKLSKLYSTYIEGLMNYLIDGKIHTIYTQTLTKTGRLSSIEPNLQNIPIRYEYGRLIRKAFVPEFDYIIGADYSQIELRIMTHIADIKVLKEAFKTGKDIHTKTASDIFKVDIKDVTSEMRRMAKAVNFGIIYGISGFGLGENLKIRANDAKEFIDKYLEAYPGIKEYMDSSIKNAKEKGYVVTLFNRKRYIPEINHSVYTIRTSGERIALNTPVQGTSADIIKLAMVKIYNKFKEEKLKTKMIIQVHDELVFDVKEDEKEKVIFIVTEIMENVLKLEVPLKVDVSVGKNWYEAK